MQPFIQSFAAELSKLAAPSGDLLDKVKGALRAGAEKVQNSPVTQHFKELAKARTRDVGTEAITRGSEVASGAINEVADRAIHGMHSFGRSKDLISHIGEALMSHPALTGAAAAGAAGYGVAKHLKKRNEAKKKD